MTGSGGGADASGATSEEEVEGEELLGDWWRPTNPIKALQILMSHDTPDRVIVKLIALTEDNKNDTRPKGIRNPIHSWLPRRPIKHKDRRPRIRQSPDLVGEFLLDC